jgi:transcriptional regulator with XRE-family HTH domain
MAPSFGQTIAEARKRASLSQKELAARIRKEDGQSISPQYLNDLERDRRDGPSDFLIQQFSAVLQLDLDLLYHRAGELPADLRDQGDDAEVIEAYRAFRRKLGKDK